MQANFNFMRFITPIILIGISVAVFLIFAKPFYDSTDPLSPGIIVLKEQITSYDKALDNNKAFENIKDKLTETYNSINQDNLIKLQKFLPSGVDNIRLILEIEQIAKPYGMVLKDVKYNVTKEEESSTTDKPKATTGQRGAVATTLTNKDYGVWDLEFSTTGTYSNFLNFTRDLEKNLRLVDVSSIQFSSDVALSANATGSILPETYKYSFKIKTYWLKNQASQK